MLLDADRRSRNEIGEDTWELFELVERSFQVDLGDYFNLAGIQVSQLAAKIHGIGNYPPSQKCISAVAFDRLRRALQETCSVARNSVRPETLVREFLPWHRRRELWRELETATGLSFPRLSMPGWLFAMCVLFPFALAVLAKPLLGVPVAWTTLLVLSGCMCVLMLRSSLPFSRAIPPGCTTVGELAESLVALNYSLFVDADEGCSASDVQKALRLLIGLATGIPVATISSETRIPGDLNIH